MDTDKGRASDETTGSTGRGAAFSSRRSLAAATTQRSDDDTRSHNTTEHDKEERSSSHTMTGETDGPNEVDNGSRKEKDEGRQHKQEDQGKQRLDSHFDTPSRTTEDGSQDEAREEGGNRSQYDQRGENDLKQEEIQEKQPGKPSQQPISQEAHRDAGYLTLNPWYAQPSDRGPTFSTAWPFPRTIRPGMLHGLDDISLSDHGLDVEYAEGRGKDRGPREGRGHEHTPRRMEDGDQINQVVRRVMHEMSSQGANKDSTTPDVRPRKQSPMTRAAPSADSIPPDIRSQRHRPTTQTMPSGDDSGKNATMPSGGEFEKNGNMPDDVPADIRPEGKRPTPGVPPQDETDKPSHHLTGRGQKHQSDTKDQLRHQASAVGEGGPSRTNSYETEELRNTWARLRARAPEPLAEYVATTVSLYIGLAGSVSKTVTDSEYGTFHTQALSWGFGVMFGIYIAGGISGAHLNPAVSITLSLFRGFPWRRCGIYIIAQFLGGLTAAGLVWLVYKDSILRFDPALLPAKSGIAFFTLPQPWVSRSAAFANEFLASVILMIVLLALGDDTNAPPGAGMNAFILGLLVTALVFTSAFQTGVALNPARDLGPRLVALWAGYPRAIFLECDLWWLWYVSLLPYPCVFLSCADPPLRMFTLRSVQPLTLCITFPPSQLADESHRGAIATPLAGCITGCTVYDTMVFTGGESPLNYRWPTKRELVDHLKGKSKRVSTKRIHDHVYASARIRFQENGGDDRKPLLGR